jgi:hypothetical protein
VIAKPARTALAMDPGSLVMERTMLGITERAERPDAHPVSRARDG